MATRIETSEFRKGLKVLYDGVPYVIVDFQHVKPGKGNQFTRTRIRNLLTGAMLDETFKSGVTLDDPEIEEKKMTFLYQEGAAFHFMDTKTYDQVELQQEAVGDMARFLLPEMACDIMFFRGRAINMDIPAHVEMKITYCEPGVKGDTATNATKPATLETGAVIQVPLFINEGDTVKVNTGSGEYLERTKIG
ncbi:MAG: elongation factor P [Deltaproteobacteria bacterium]|nr:elongation factor P [Deltaproteobacteria bacterium]